MERSEGFREVGTSKVDSTNDNDYPSREDGVNITTDEWLKSIGDERDEVPILKWIQIDERRRKSDMMK